MQAPFWGLSRVPSTPQPHPVHPGPRTCAQGLKAPITDAWKLRSSDQRLYLQTEQALSGCCVVLGGLKVGKKKLFMHRVSEQEAAEAVCAEGVCTCWLAGVSATCISTAQAARQRPAVSVSV